MKCALHSKNSFIQTSNPDPSDTETRSDSPKRVASRISDLKIILSLLLAWIAHLRVDCFPVLCDDFSDFLP